MDVLQELQGALSDRFTIHGMVGEGGMAFVYEATDEKHGRKVAIKVLKPEIASDLGSERFLREIRIVARLSHPNVMPLHESGEVHGILYYVMPLVTGENLRDRLQRSPPLTLDEKLRIVREVAQALGYAHREGVIHRDLKPANIMLSGGIAVVTDFGIARAHEYAGGEQLTQAGLAVGTPTYMSPEQATGEAPVDARSDIYSLGCILHELLTGNPPYSGASAMSVIAKHAGEAVPDLEKTHPEIPAGLSRAVRRSLAKEQSERFASAEEFVLALDAVPQGAGRAPAGAGDGRLRRRSTITRLILAAAVIVMATALTLVARRPIRSAEAATVPLLAVLPFKHIGPADEKYFADGITDEISGRIGDVSGIAVVSRTSALQFSLDRNSLKEIGDKLKAGYVLVGSVRTDKATGGIANVHVSSTLVNVKTGRETVLQAQDTTMTPGAIFAVQSSIARSVAKFLNVALSPEAVDALERRPTTNLQAYGFYLRGIVNASQFLVRDEQLRAIEMFEKATQIDPQFALAHARLAQVQSQYYRIFERTPDRLSRWQAAVERATALDATLPQTKVARGQWLFYAQRDYQGVMAEIEDLRRTQPNNTALLSLLGGVQRTRGDFSGALTTFDAVSVLDPRSAIFPFESATALFMLGRFSDALARIDRAGELAPDWLPPKTSRPRLLHLLNRRDEARSLLNGLLPELPAVLPQLINEPLYRDLWDTVYPEAYQDALARVTLSASRSDSAEYYLVKAGLYRRRSATSLYRAYSDSALALLTRRRASGASGVFIFTDLGTAAAGVQNLALARAYADSASTADLLKTDAFRGWFASVELARLYMRVGAPERALDVLEALKAGGRTVPAMLLTSDPVFASVQQQPRMRALTSAK